MIHRLSKSDDRVVKTIPAKDKVLNIAFAVCVAFLFSDHLAFTANFQPNLAVPLILGKFLAGAIAIAIAFKIAIPKALQLEKEQEDAAAVPGAPTIETVEATEPADE